MAATGEWHYTAVVFAATGPVSGGSITGDFTFYFDGTEATETVESVTISDFGDSLNRTISVGAHPLGFGGDFFNGLIFEPRVSLAALAPEELLYQSAPSGGPEIINFEPGDGVNQLTWTSLPGRTYLVEFSLNLEDWLSAATPMAEGETTTFDHVFVPEFEELVDAPAAYYRVTLQD